MPEYADAVVVGARCAGAPAAMLLARAGRRVVLLERGQVGTDTISTLYIQPPGMVRLEKWGVLDDIVATGPPALETASYCIDGTIVSGRASWPASTPMPRAPRRRDLDRILAGAAARAGADLRLHCSFTGVLEQDGRVRGVRYTVRGADGRQRELEVHSPLVVGADGMRSRVAAAVGAATSQRDPTLTCAYYTYWDTMTTTFGMYESHAGWVSCVPTSGGRVLVSAYFPQADFARVRGAALASYHACVAAVAPGLDARMPRGRHAEPLTGFGDQQNFFRQAWGPGWALVGDAGHHKDSLTARGIGDAFLQADLLSHHLAGADGPRAQDAALARFAADRDAMLADSYRATLVAADPAARPARARVLAAVAQDRGLQQRYLDTVAGLAPVSALYTDELLGRLNEAPVPSVVS